MVSDEEMRLGVPPSATPDSTGQPVRDLDQTSETGEHLDRLDVIVGVPRPGGNKDEAFCVGVGAC